MPKFVTDSAGDSRGNNSVDTQFFRLSADQVTSGMFSTILAGENNKITDQNSTILGGSSNEITGQYSTVVGNQNLVTGNYAILFGNNNEIKRDLVFFGGDNNTFDTTSNITGNAHIFGLGIDSYDNGDGNFYTVLAAREFSLGNVESSSSLFKSTANYSSILGGRGANTIYSDQVVRSSNIFPKVVDSLWENTRAQESSILFDSGKIWSLSANDIIPIYNGNIVTPFGLTGSQNLKVAPKQEVEHRYDITVNWIITTIDLLPDKAAFGVDHIVIYRRENQPTKVFVNNISKIGDLAPVVTPVYTLINPFSSSLTPTDDLHAYFRISTQGSYRAGAQFRVLEDSTDYPDRICPDLNFYPTSIRKFVPGGANFNFNNLYPDPLIKYKISFYLDYYIRDLDSSGNLKPGSERNKLLSSYITPAANTLGQTINGNFSVVKFPKDTGYYFIEIEILFYDVTSGLLTTIKTCKYPSFRIVAS